MPTDNRTEAARQWQANRRKRVAESGSKHVLVPLPPECLAFLDSVPRQRGKRGSRPAAIENVVRAAMQAVEDGRIEMEELTISKP